MLLDFIIKPKLIISSWEEILKDILESFAEELNCSLNEITLIFRVYSKEVLMMQVIHQNKKVEQMEVLGILERMIKGFTETLASNPAIGAMLNQLDVNFQESIEEFFSDKEAANQSLVEVMGDSTLIVATKDDCFFYARKKEGEKPTKINLTALLTKEKIKEGLNKLQELK